MWNSIGEVVIDLFIFFRGLSIDSPDRSPENVYFQGSLFACTIKSKPLSLSFMALHVLTLTYFSHLSSCHSLWWTFFSSQFSLIFVLIHVLHSFMSVLCWYSSFCLECLAPPKLLKHLLNVVMLHIICKALRIPRWIKYNSFRNL